MSSRQSIKDDLQRQLVEIQEEESILSELDKVKATVQTAATLLIMTEHDLANEQAALIKVERDAREAAEERANAAEAKVVEALAKAQAEVDARSAAESRAASFQSKEDTVAALVSRIDELSSKIEALEKKPMPQPIMQSTVTASPAPAQKRSEAFNVQVLSRDGNNDISSVKVTL